MMSAYSRTKYTVFCAVFTGAAALALFTGAPTLIKGIFALTYAMGNGMLVGKKILPNERFGWRVFFGTLTFIAALTVIGAVTYLLFRLDTTVVRLLLLIFPFIGIFLPKSTPPDETVFSKTVIAPQDDGRPVTRRILGMLLGTVYIIIIGYGITLLMEAATELTIRSPWDVVPRMFFIIVFLAALGIFTLAYSGVSRGLSAIIPAAFLTMLGTLVAVIVYDVGFGFDPFIHQATESTIFIEGIVTPKPFYYLGQYALVTFIAKLIGGHVVLIDKLLVPIFASTIIPVAYWSLSRSFGWKPRIALAAALGTLMIPLSSFIMTTPQGLANILMLLTAFLALPAVTKRSFPRTVLLLFGITAAVIHPLAGIPLLLFVGIIIFLTTYGRLQGAHEVGRKMILAEIIIIGSIALPGIFLLNSLISSSAGVQLDTESISSATAVIGQLVTDDGIESRQFKAVFDLVYFWRTQRTAMILLLALIAVFLLRRNRKVATIYAVSFIVFTANYVLLKTLITFPFLIEYEQSNYADRILELSVFLASPLAIYAFGRTLRRIDASYPALKIGVALMVATLVTSSVYLAYPRRDSYESSRGWSTSMADVEAVRLISEDASGADFVTLANQSVSAAAIREFGFRSYFPSQDESTPGELFYYPIPTGDALYGVFLDMNEALGDPNVARDAMRLTGVDTVYYVVNHYWWNAQAIIISAGRTADEWWNIDDKIYIFKYIKPILATL